MPRIFRKLAGISSKAFQKVRELKKARARRFRETVRGIFEMNGVPGLRRFIKENPEQAAKVAQFIKYNIGPKDWTPGERKFLRIYFNKE